MVRRFERDEQGYSDLKSGLKGKKVGIVKEYFGDGLDPQVSESIEAAIDELKAAGASVEEISIPSIDLALAIYYVVVPAELSSNLARHDGSDSNTAMTMPKISMKVMN